MMYNDGSIFFFLYFKEISTLKAKLKDAQEKLQSAEAKIKVCIFCLLLPTKLLFHYCFPSIFY